MSNASQRHKLEIHNESNDLIDLGTAPAQIRSDGTAVRLTSGDVVSLDVKPYFEFHSGGAYTYADTLPPTGLTLNAATGYWEGTVGAPGTNADFITVTHTASTDTSDIAIAWTIV